SQSLRASRSLVYVAKVLISCSTFPPLPLTITHPTTIFLCTSKPAQRAYITCILSPFTRGSPLLADTFHYIILLCVLREALWASFGDNRWCNQASGSDFCADSQVPPSETTSASSRTDRTHLTEFSSPVENEVHDDFCEAIRVSVPSVISCS